MIETTTAYRVEGDLFTTLDEAKAEALANALWPDLENEIEEAKVKKRVIASVMVANAEAVIAILSYDGSSPPPVLPRKRPRRPVAEQAAEWKAKGWIADLDEGGRITRKSDGAERSINRKVWEAMKGIA